MQNVSTRKSDIKNYDSAGNLVGATVIRSDLLLKAKYKIKIEYVIE